jgi:CheY-like chemotaxis protein
MEKKLKRVLLIDDDPLTNMLNTRIIKKLGASEETVAYTSAKDALDYLQQELPDGEYPTPDLICLDINMPGMNGWEFLDAYLKLDKKHHAAHILMMLTSSANPDDLEKAKTYQIINGFLTKPLTDSMFMEILFKYFPSASL